MAAMHSLWLLWAVLSCWLSFVRPNKTDFCVLPDFDSATLYTTPNRYLLFTTSEVYYTYYVLNRFHTPTLPRGIATMFPALKSVGVEAPKLIYWNPGIDQTVVQLTNGQYWLLPEAYGKQSILLVNLYDACPKRDVTLIGLREPPHLLVNRFGNTFNATLNASNKTIMCSAPVKAFNPMLQKAIAVQTYPTGPPTMFEFYSGKICRRLFDLQTVECDNQIEDREVLFSCKAGSEETTVASSGRLYATAGTLMFILLLVFIAYVAKTIFDSKKDELNSVVVGSSRVD